MPVARTYQNYHIEGEPFIQNGRKYVAVKTPTGVVKNVRWYTDAEYARMYPEAKPVCAYDYRKALGFKDAGYITVYFDKKKENEWWFKKEPNCYYHKIWGWYTHSDKEIPANIPDGVSIRKLYWNNVSTPEGEVTEASAQKGYDMISFDKATGNFIGNIGDRLDLVLVVNKIYLLQTRYGVSHMHIMHDEYGNEFIWTTSSRTLMKLTPYHIRGTVKDHRVYKGKNQTILTRCSGFEDAVMRYHTKEEKVNG